MGASQTDLGNIADLGVRFIGKFDVKDSRLVKTRRLEGLRDLGDGLQGIRQAISLGVEELYINDTVATLYSKEPPLDFLTEVRTATLNPITFAGGVASVQKARDLISAGADRIALNSALFGNLELLKQLEDELGAQSVVLQVDAMLSENKWWVTSNAGRETHGISLETWLDRTCQIFSGEILLTAINAEGLGRGFPRDILPHVTDVENGVILCGGLSSFDEIVELSKGSSALSFSGSGIINGLSRDQLRSSHAN